MSQVMEKLFNCGIVPVVKIDDAASAAPLVEALLAGGIDVAEITFRTAAAEQAIRNISEKFPEVLVGAGTVLNPETAEKAINAGAKFIVSPGFNPRVVEYCLEHKVPVMPGVGGPTDIEAALNYGLTDLKFFPAEANGGLKALKAMSAPYGMVRFMPTGGIDASNLADYLAFDKIIACGGSWMVKDDLIKAGAFADITRLTKEAVNTMHGFRFAHMGINPEGSSSKAIADLFADVFGFKQRETSASVFATDFIEIMNAAGPGQCGHIGIKAINVKRAMAYFEKRGIALDYETVREKNGVPTFVYLKDSFGPFKVHVLQ